MSGTLRTQVKSCENLRKFIRRGEKKGLRSSRRPWRFDFFVMCSLSCEIHNKWKLRCSSILRKGKRLRSCVLSLNYATLTVKWNKTCFCHKDYDQFAWSETSEFRRWRVLWWQVCCGGELTRYRKKDMRASSLSLFVSPAKPIWSLAPAIAANNGFKVQAFNVN